MNGALRIHIYLTKVRGDSITEDFYYTSQTYHELSDGKIPDDIRMIAEHIAMHGYWNYRGFTPPERIIRTVVCPI